MNANGRFVPVWVLLIAISTVSVSAASLGYRGLNNSGVYEAQGLLKAWPEQGPPLLWKKQLGHGYCSANVLGDRVYIVGGGGTCRLHVLSLDGTEQGSAVLGNASFKRFGGSRSTPLIAAGVAVGTLPNGDLIGIDLGTLEQRWTLNAWKSFGSGSSSMGWGLPETPLLHNGTVIFHTVSRDDQTPPLIAVDIRNGKQVWGMDPGTGKAYSAADLSAACFRHNGRDLIIAPTYCYQVCMEADTGKVLWEIPSPGSRNFTPVYADGHLLLSLNRPLINGLPDPLPQDWFMLTPRERMRRSKWTAEQLVMLKLNEDGSGYRAQWVRPWGGSFSHAAMLNERIYLFGPPDGWVERIEDGAVPAAQENDRKRHARSLLCLDARTGKVLMTAPAGSYGHIVAADGMVYVLDLVQSEHPATSDTRACLVPRLRLLQPTPEGFTITGDFQPLKPDECGENRLKEEQIFESHVAPFIAQGRLFVRYNYQLVFDLRDPERYREEPIGRTPQRINDTSQADWKELVKQHALGAWADPLLLALDAWLEEDRANAIERIVGLTSERRRILAPLLTKTNALRGPFAWRVQKAAAQSLMQMGEDAAGVLPSLKSSVMEVLEHRDSALVELWLKTMLHHAPGTLTDLLPTLDKILREGDEEHRLTLLIACNNLTLDLSPLAEAVTQSLEAHMGQLRNEAHKALQRAGVQAWSTGSVRESFIKQIQKALLSENPARVNSMQSLLNAVDGETARLVTRGIASLLKHEDQGVARQALQTMGYAKVLAEDAARVVIPLLSSEDERTCSEATRALSRLDPSADSLIPEIIALLTVERVEVRLTALKVLTALGARAESSAPTLFKGIEHADRRYVSACLGALQAIGFKLDKTRLRSLEAIIKGKDKQLALSAIETLSSQANDAQDALVLLRQSLRSSDRELREASYRNLISLGIVPLNELTDMANHREEPQRIAWAAQKIAQLGASARSTQKVLLETLGRCRDLDALSALVEALQKIGVDDPQAQSRLLALAQRTQRLTEQVQAVLQESDSAKSTTGSSAQ